MNYIGELLALSPQEFRVFVKTNENDSSFILEISNEKETYIPILLKNKILPEEAEKKILDQKDGPLFLLNKYIEYNYIPGPNFLDKIIEISDQETLKFLKAFPSYPVSVSVAIKMINLGLMASSVYLVKNKKELQKEEILFILIKSGIIDPQISSLAKGSKFVLSRISEEIDKRSSQNSGDFKICPEVLGAAINFNPDIQYGSISGLILPKESLESFLNSKKISNEKEKEAGNSWSYYRNSTMAWIPALEEIDVSLLESLSITVSEPPVGSKFRKNWLISYPEESLDEEFFTFKEDFKKKLNFSNKRYSSSLNKVLILRGRKLLDHYGAEEVLESMDTHSLEQSISVLLSEDKLDYVLYLFEKSPARLKKIFRKKIPVEKIPEKFNARKRSYFDEAHSALIRGDVDEFRSILSGSYTLDKFIDDGFLSSKQSKITSSYSFIKSETFEKLSVEENMKLNESNYRYSIYRGCISVNEFSERFNSSQAVSLLSKLPLSVCFIICNEKESFLNKIPASLIVDLLDAEESILENPSLMKIIIKRFKSTSINKDDHPSSQTIENLAKFLTKTEIRSLFSLTNWDKDGYLLRELCLTKCSDGEWLIDESEIIKNASIFLEYDSSYLDKLILRTPEFSKKFLEAYLKGNKALTSLFGSPTQIRRKERSVTVAKEKLKSITTSDEDFFSELTGYIDDHIRIYPDFVQRVKKAQKKDLVLRMKNLNNSWESRSLDVLESLPDSKFFIETISIENRTDTEFLKRLTEISNFTANRIKISEIQSNEVDLYSESIKKLLKKTSDQTLSIDEKNLISFLKKGFSVSNQEEEVSFVLNNKTDFSDYEISELNFIEELGFVFSKERVKGIIKDSSNSEVVLNWLSNRLGPLSDYYVSEDFFRYYEEKEESAKKLGLRVLKKDDFFLEETKDLLLSSGQNFSKIAFSKNFSSRKKLEIIKFIEDKIDKRFKSLNLGSSNLSNLEFLSNFEEMKSSNPNDEELVSIFRLNNLSGSKKSLNSLKDLISLRGHSLVIKVEKVSYILQSLNRELDLVYSDFIEIQKNVEVKENSFIENMSLSTLLAIEEGVNSGLLFFLSKKPKSHIFSFLKSCLKVEQSYYKDVSDMIVSIKNGVLALEERISIAEEEEQKTPLIEAKSRIESRLSEILEMNDIEHIHDRLVPILSFIKSDPLQPLGQDKFRKIEKDLEVEKKLGFKLFFPKTREDLIFLGDQNGWCVNYHKSYGDNVISKGNLLIGICEAGAESDRENVVALAHFLNEGRGQYTLEQLKWSSKKKNGSRNVDATRDFDHKLIKSIVTEFISSMKEKEKNE